ncbi:hypothetical protein PInf_006679 [Phytophthora infestans]|nr:hypothetical protein PInf_006679 [Phytophthora infestans]
MEPCQLERKQLVSCQIQETDARIMKVFKAIDGKVEAITGKVIKAIALRVNAYGENTTLKLCIRIPHAIQAASAQGRISLDDWGWRNPLADLTLHNSVSEPQVPFNRHSQA